MSCGGGANSLDAALILQLAAHLVVALPCSDAGDVNRDGAVDVVDALVILQYAAGLVGVLPVQSIRLAR